MKTKETRSWLGYPKRAYRLPDGSIHARCEHCEGTGREFIFNRSSNNPGSEDGTITRNKCAYCDGKIYERNAVEIIDMKKK